MQNFLAAISRLPNEMLLAIFEEAVACQDPGEEQRAELTISKVSRRWRDLAIHSPRLWRRVCITPRVAPTMLEMYKTRASRALDIEIWGWRDRRDFQRFDTALETMLDSFSRWRGLSIACVCDTHLSHLNLKLSHTGNLSGLKHFTFRALRPGQTCPVSFLMESATLTQPQPSCQALSSCTLKSLDAENFMLTGDLASIHVRTTQTLSRLSSLTLRRYSNDRTTRSSRTMIDFSAFRAMLHGIPNLTTLVLHGQPLRFRTDPVGVQQGPDAHGSGVGGGIGATTNNTTVSLPHLHTLVLHPGVLKPHYLQQTISAIHAPALRHFELVFPDSKFSGQSIVERLFVDASSSSSFRSSSSSTSYASYSSFSSATEEQTNRRCLRFPHVETIVLHNTSNARTALAFIQAFPYIAQATLGGVDAGFFLPVLRTGVGSGAEDGVGAGPGSRSRMLARSGSGPETCEFTCVGWHRLRTLTLRQPRPETLRVLYDWIRNGYERGHATPMIIVEGSLEGPDIQFFAQCARMYTRVELVGIPISA